MSIFRQLGVDKLHQVSLRFVVSLLQRVFSQGTSATAATVGRLFCKFCAKNHSHLELKQWPALLQWGVVALAPSLSRRRRLCCDWCQAIAGGWQEFTKLLQELRPVFAVVRLPLPEFLCLRAGLNSKRRPKQLTRSPSSCCKSGGDWLCLWTHASLSLHYVA